MDLLKSIEEMRVKISVALSELPEEKRLEILQQTGIDESFDKAINDINKLKNEYTNSSK